MTTRHSFLCDRMLGKLCRKLRLLGFDAMLNPDGEEGRFLLNAERDGRIAVTRARRRYDRPGRPAIILRSDTVSDQIVELLGRLPRPPQLAPFTRCLECNEVLVGASAEEIRGEVPVYVAEHFDRYHRCPACQRLYWEGSHFQAMSAEIDEIGARIARNSK